MARCPYCGSDGWLMSFGYMADYPWGVECTKVLCHARSRGYTKDEAVNRWNDGNVEYPHWSDDDKWTAKLMVESGLTHWRSNNG